MKPELKLINGCNKLVDEIYDNFKRMFYIAFLCGLFIGFNAGMIIIFFVIR